MRFAHCSDDESEWEEISGDEAAEAIQQNKVSQTRGRGQLKAKEQVVASEVSDEEVCDFLFHLCRSFASA